MKNIDLKFIESKFGSFLASKKLKGFLVFLARKWFFIALGIIFLAGVYFISHFAYLYKWNEDKKQEVLNEKRSEVLFDEKGFRETVDEVKIRQENFSKDFSGVEDVFR